METAAASCGRHLQVSHCLVMIGQRFVMLEHGELRDYASVFANGAAKLIVVLASLKTARHNTGRNHKAGGFLKKLRFLVSLMTQNNDYQKWQASSVQEAAGKLGVDIEIVHAENDGLTQGQQILKSIQSPVLRPDGVLCQPAGTALAVIAETAAAAGVGWALLNREAEYTRELRTRFKTPVFSIGSNHLEIGKMQGRQIGALLPSGGIVLYVQGTSANISAQLRTNGMNQAKPDNVEIRMIRGDWTEEGAHNAVRAWLTLSTSPTLPLGLVACQNDMMALGARTALMGGVVAKHRDRVINLPITGCDGCPETGQEWVRKGLLAATVVRHPNAGRALEMMVNGIHIGSQPPPHTDDQIASFPTIEELTSRQREKVGSH